MDPSGGLSVPTGNNISQLEHKIYLYSLVLSGAREPDTLCNTEFIPCE